MSKSIIIILMAAVLCQPCFSEKNITQQQTSVDALFSKFSKDKKVTHVKIGGFIMLLASAFTETKGTTGVEVFSFDECDESVKEKLNIAINNLNDSSFETLISTTQNGEKTKVLVKIKNDYINEIVIVAGGSHPALVRIKGKIKPDDFQNFSNYMK